MFYLHIRTLGGHERRIPVPPGVTSVGRFFGNSIVLDEYGVSGRHAELEVAGPDVLLRDLASTNGLFVNGRRVESARLQPGDRVLLGSVVVVLQEALSDRIRLDTGELAPSRGGDVPPSPLERAYVPTDPLPATSRWGTDPAIARDPAGLLDLLQEVLVEAGDGSEGLARATAALTRFLGAAEGSLVRAQGADGWRLLASTGAAAAVAPAAGVLRQCAETGAEICVDATERPGEGNIAIAIPNSGRPGAALYLRLAQSAMGAARERLAALRPALAAIALLLRRHEADSESRRTRLALAQGLTWLPGAGGSLPAPDDLIAHSAAMREVLDHLERAAPERGPIVLRGEIGVGKLRAARWLHASSASRRGPFLHVRCGGATEAEDREALFGAGGRFDLAEGGTAYLDEVAALDGALQQALARWLASEPPVRLVVGTRLEAGAPLDGLDPALAGPLQSAANVAVPPLRERKDDVIPLAQAFTRSAAASAHRRVLGLSTDACRALRDHRWPGNVSELRSVIVRAVLLARDPIVDVDLLPFDIAGGRFDLPGLDTLAVARENSWREAKLAFERVYFAEVLRSHDGNVAGSAKHAGIARKNLYRKLRQLGLAPKGD